MKKTLLIILSLMAGSVSNAQDTDKKPTGSVSLNGGVSIPLGDFANVNIGGASSGYNFHMNYSAPLFKSHFGLTTIISTSGYAMTDEPFKAQQRSLLEPLGYVEGFHYDLKSNNIGTYSENRVLLGLYTTIPFTKRLSLDSRILFGIIFIDRPEVKIDFDDYYDNYYVSYTQSASSSTVLAYNFGFGLRYNLGKKQKLCMILGLDYVGSSSADFVINCKSLYADSPTSIVDNGQNTITQSYSISSFNTTFGIGYVFGKKEK